MTCPEMVRARCLFKSNLYSSKALEGLEVDNALTNASKERGQEGLGAGMSKE